MAKFKAVALNYEKNSIPEIVSLGEGSWAEKIVEIAKESGIVVYKDDDLVEVLSRLKPGNQIPEDLYKSVAEILAFCYNMNDKFRNKLDNF